MASGMQFSGAQQSIVLDAHSAPRARDLPAVCGELVKMWGQTFYCINHYDLMRPFLMSVVSPSDHWLYISSTGGLTAGRLCSDNALFPYGNADQVHDSHSTTGGVTVIRCRLRGVDRVWRPFAQHPESPWRTRRRLLKNVCSTTVIFEERNDDLGLEFLCSWSPSEPFGFVRRSKLRVFGDDDRTLEILDGVRNVLPAGTDSTLQRQLSSLVDAYKRAELDPDTGLAVFALQSLVTDQPVPMESLRATSVWQIGLPDPRLTVDPAAVDAFVRGVALRPSRDVRGERGAYLAQARTRLSPGDVLEWSIVADVAQSQAQVVETAQRLHETPRADLQRQVVASTERAAEEVKALVGRADGLQMSGLPVSTAHHFANTLFNLMRGGTPRDGYVVVTEDFLQFLSVRSRRARGEHGDAIAALGESNTLATLLAHARSAGDRQLERLTLEYLPLFFGRRHGDPSRPWNTFQIRVRNAEGRFVCDYQGNWRDIFQNWEALARSFPGFIESMIARFLNASTVDGYNPYRVDRHGVDWERVEQDSPWANIGYWGDHQAIYLLRLMELARDHFPEVLPRLMTREVFSFANVPYEVVSFEEMLEDPRHTVRFDEARDRLVAERVTAMGTDGQLVLDGTGEVVLTNLVDKLLILVLTKLCSFAPGGGIWMNTQRPEWNDANNALVGHGVSLVTACYLLRLLDFFSLQLQEADCDRVRTSRPVAALLRIVTSILDADGTKAAANDGCSRSTVFQALGRAGSEYRRAVYNEPFGPKEELQVAAIFAFLLRAREALQETIRSNRRGDGLYHSYNLLSAPGQRDTLEIEHLDEMLEGQVAVLSCEALALTERVALLQSLRKSRLYREDQHSYMLYPNLAPLAFLARNRVSEERLAACPLLVSHLQTGNTTLVQRDVGGTVRFHPDIVNATELDDRLETQRLREPDNDLVSECAADVRDIYEATFRHRAYTGRSGSMFSFEGVGSVYWHMVAKLLLAIQESVFEAVDSDARESVIEALRCAYWEAREGLGYRKDPASYGAFPPDPYSHTPMHRGASQPGMTGQVKEEIITRWGELGVRIRGGSLHIDPVLLEPSEFCDAPGLFEYFGVRGGAQRLELPHGSLAFTFCQVPVVYERGDSASHLVVHFEDERQPQLTMNALRLPRDLTRSIVTRAGRVARLHVKFDKRVSASGEGPAADPTGLMSTSQAPESSDPTRTPEAPTGP